MAKEIVQGTITVANNLTAESALIEKHSSNRGTQQRIIAREKIPMHGGRGRGGSVSGTT